jgi:hypothetical protein
LLRKTKLRNTAKSLPRGGPFRKGNDPRRNVNGQRSKNVVAFSKNLRELLVQIGEQSHTSVVRDEDGRIIRRETRKNVEWLSRVIWKRALEGKEFYVQFIAERVEGKIPQGIGFQGDDGEIDSKLIIEIIQTK